MTTVTQMIKGAATGINRGWESFIKRDHLLFSPTKIITRLTPQPSSHNIISQDYINHHGARTAHHSQNP
jgi:hypothetical protein